MPIIHEENTRTEALKDVARKMMTAARTAPKARGIDNLVIAVAEGETIKMLSDKMKEIALETGEQFFERDSNNILFSPSIVLIGTRIASINLKKCGMCGFENCDEKKQHANHPCALNTGDLGIAIGSAVSVAADNRVDCRIMFSIGQAALRLNLLDETVKIIYGIPLSATSKSPFFDRK
jgi:uncharacterized ferredoxin-like protein